MNAGKRRQTHRAAEDWDRLNVPDALKRQLAHVAREFRREPTTGEAILWTVLRGRSLHGRKFRRQQPIGPFVLDFYGPSARLALEVDGGVHDDPEQRRLDGERQRLIESLGIRFVRLRDDLVCTDLDAALTIIASNLAGHSESYISPSPLVGEDRPKAGVRAPRVAAKPGINGEHR